MTVFVTLIILSIFLAISHAYQITITPRSQECFFEELQPKERMLTTYEVVSGGMLDINIRVQGPDGKVVYEQEREKEGSFQFFATDKGAYQVCFSNAMSTMTSKQVSFNMYAGHDLHRFNNAKVDHIEPLDKAVMSLTESTRKLSDSYSYVRARLLRAHSTTEASYERVLYWGIFNIILAVLGLLLRTICIVRPFESNKGILPRNNPGQMGGMMPPAQQTTSFMPLPQSSGYQPHSSFGGNMYGNFAPRI